MCTSNIAGNTQMASLDRQVTQNGLWVNNAIARGTYNGGIPRYQDDMEVTVEGFSYVWTDDSEVVKVDDGLEAMMSGGVLDVQTKIMETRS